MSKIMKQERVTVMKAAREIYEGENLENYLKTISKKEMQYFCKKVRDQFLKNLEKDHPGKNFVIGKPSVTRANIANRISSVLKG